MIPITLIIGIILSFLISFLIAPHFMRFLRFCKIEGIDVHKKHKPTIPEMGGPIILIGVMGGLFFFIWVKVFLYGSLDNLIQIFVAISTILIIGLIGIFDDLTRLKTIKYTDIFGNKKRGGLKQWQKPLLTLPAAVPLMAIMAGNSSITLPILGAIDVGIFFPLILVPIIIVGASNAMNMLGGLNGLEAGMGFVLLTTLGIHGFIHNNIFVMLLSFIFAASLLAFLIFNFYPAKIMPGDSLSYLIGASVGVIAIIGNMEKFAFYCFTLWFIEFFLKSLSGFRAQSFGIIQPDNTLKKPYSRPHSLTHIIMSLGRFKERTIVLIIIGLQVIISIISLILFI